MASLLNVLVAMSLFLTVGGALAQFANAASGVSKEASVEKGLYTRAWATTIWNDILS